MNTVCSVLSTVTSSLGKSGGGVDTERHKTTQETSTSQYVTLEEEEDINTLYSVFCTQCAANAKKVKAPPIAEEMDTTSERSLNDDMDIPSFMDYAIILYSVLVLWYLFSFSRGMTCVTPVTVQLNEKCPQRTTRGRHTNPIEAAQGKSSFLSLELRLL